MAGLLDKVQELLAQLLIGKRECCVLVGHFELECKLVVWSVNSPAGAAVCRLKETVENNAGFEVGRSSDSRFLSLSFALCVI